jgi:hypothetical protein
VANVIGREEPRLWVPPLRELTPDTSFGFECIRFGEELLGLHLTPWQRWLLIHGLELAAGYTTKDPNPLFRFDVVVVIVSRQNGKTELIKVKKLWRMFVDRASTVLATAQDLGRAEKTWEQAVSLVEGEPELFAEVLKQRGVVRRNGHHALRLQGGREYLVKAPTDAGRGESAVEDLDLDELRTHATWEAWNAIAPTTLSAPRSQIWGWSNAGGLDSVVLAHLRLQGMRHTGVDAEELEAFTKDFALEDAPTSAGDDVELGGEVGLFEWSMTPGASLDDWDELAQANPSLGHGFLTHRKLRGLINATPAAEAAEEYGCQWRSSAAIGPFGRGAWEECIDESSDWTDTSRVTIGIDMDEDRGTTYVAMAGYRTDGDVHVEVVTARPGVDWIPDWLLSPDRVARHRWDGVMWQRTGAPVSALTDLLGARQDCKRLPLRSVDAGAVANALGTMRDLVKGEGWRVWHFTQPALDVPAQTAAVKHTGNGAYVLDRRKSECASLVAATLACHGLLNAPVRGPSVYESRDLMVV